MKSIIIIACFITSVAGGFIGVKLALSSDKTTTVANKIDDNLAAEKNLQFSLNPLSELSGNDEKTLSNSSHLDLTYASEKTVKTVVHVQTHFVREQLVYDPFAAFFYGENAYKIREQHGQSSGSGVIISPDGYIVTNNHVVQDAKEINIVIENTTYTAKLVGTDPSTDLAVIKIEAENLDYSMFGNSDELRLGEWVLAVGNPLNLQSTVTAGIVSAKNRNIDLLASQYNPKENVFPIESFIQTDAAVNSGNSGGALVNTSGELVGINTAIASGNGFYTGYSFAIPSNIVKKVTYDLIAYGSVHRVQLGANLSNNNSEIAKKNLLTTDNGILITSLTENGNAKKSGLLTNDLILAIDGKKVSSVAEFQGLLVLYNPGDTVQLQIKRGEIEKEIELKLD